MDYDNFDCEDGLEQRPLSSYVRKGEKDTSFADRFIRLLDNGETEEVIVITEIRIGGLDKVEGDGISYGNPIEINLDNLHDLSLDNDIVTMGMDKNGNFYLETEEGWDTDFDEISP